MKLVRLQKAVRNLSSNIHSPYCLSRWLTIVRYALRNNCALVHWYNTVHWHNTVHWYTGTLVHWYTGTTLCTGTLVQHRALVHWYNTVVNYSMLRTSQQLCTGTLVQHCALVHWYNTVHWYTGTTPWLTKVRYALRNNNRPKFNILHIISIRCI